MNKYAKAFLAALLITLLALQGTSLAEPVQVGLVKMNQGSNVRSLPDTNSAQVGKADAGYYYGCFSAEDGWYLIQLANGDMGYVSAKRCTFYNTTPAVPQQSFLLREDAQQHFMPGDLVLFGTYEQDNNTANGPEPIEWIVLERDEEAHQLLLISRFALDRQHFHTTNSNATWETCGLRKWLNNDFFHAAFSPEEQALIPLSLVSADRNEEKNVSAGKNTYDHVFLLSISEAERYMTKETLLCMPTAYTIVHNGYYDENTGGCWWWLRTPGHNRMHTAYGNWKGEISSKGYGVISNKGAVRPVIRIMLDQPQ